jgi:asparagine synthase (glutamine-hydrolysing)
LATGVLAHRGPDGDGLWVGAEIPVALGHRRLAIIDLSPNARQPMESTDGRRVITYNGELYNYRELRDRLKCLGHSFRTESDTEVLIAGCREWGPAECARRAKGMFAFAYVDLDSRVMWLVRDRFGEKPLYWAIWNGSLAFASELKALRQLPEFPTTIDRNSVASFLAHDSISAPHTIYAGVNQLTPGTALRVRLSDDIASTDVTENVYWDAINEARVARSEQFTGSFDEAVDVLDAVLGASVQGSMVSDVPLGAFLSGVSIRRRSSHSCVDTPVGR